MMTFLQNSQGISHNINDGDRFHINQFLVFRARPGINASIGVIAREKRAIQYPRQLVRNVRLGVTGCPAFAGHDTEMIHLFLDACLV